MATSTFPKINQLLAEMREEYKTGIYDSMEECLLGYIRKRRYWPAIQMKKFFGNSGLVLLHNTYKRTDVHYFQELYDEVRSVVLDLNAPEGHNIVVCLADKIPERMSHEEYKKVQKDTDTFEECYEGSMVYAYNHNNQWFFSTSTCPNVNSSKYFHPTKTHGVMFDEALQSMFADDTSLEEVRKRFSLYLNPEYSYGFLLVHHQNRNVIDYTDFYRKPDYAMLYHIFTREKATMQPVKHDLSDINIQYPLIFDNAETALEELVKEPLYGLLIRSEAENKVYKVSIPDIIKAETENISNANPWVNLLHVYMQQNPEFKVNDYIEKYYSDKKNTLVFYDTNGQELVPVYIIHTVMMTLKMMLYSFYNNTTSYDVNTKTYLMDKALDQQFEPVIRFHLAQLRNIQVTSHRHAPLTAQTVYHYLCLHQTMKNMRLLIKHVAKSPYYNLSYKAGACFKCLASVL